MTNSGNNLEVQDSHNWRIADLCPNIPLQEISPISERVNSLVFRSMSQEILRSNFMTVMGVVEILRGLDYHAKRYLDLVDERGKGRSEVEQDVNHEANAYFNRLGQFWYFIISKFVKSRIPNVVKTVPRLSELTIFRHKYSAHRSIDKPDGIDSEESRVWQSMIFWGSIWQPKSKDAVGKHENVWASHFRVYQIHDDNKCVNFTFETDHPIVMDEAFKVMSSLLGAE